jgi:chemotaxis protein histidine kinase CheA
VFKQILTIKFKDMKTTSMRTAGVIFTAGILLTSCVSSKKYHKSQDEVAKLRQDSTMLAQKDSTLTQNLNTAQQQNTDLQKNVETANATNTGLQKNVAFYADNVTKTKTSADQMKGELSTTLSAAGLTDQDITQTDAKVYINLAEKNLFRANSAVLTAKGKELVNSIGEYVKSKENVDVSVADLGMSTSIAGAGMETSSGSMSSTDAGTNTGNSNMDASSSSSKSASGTTTKRKIRRSAASSTAKASPSAGEKRATVYSSGPRKSSMSSARAKRAMAWQRQNAVANALLQNGLPKVKLVQQNQGSGTDATGAQKGVQVVLTPDMDAFYKTLSEAPATQTMGKNP